MKSHLPPSLKKIPLSMVFDALSDPVRIEILRHLLNNDEVSCGDCKCGLSKSTMSHHFKVLREAGLIQRRERGVTHLLSIRKSEIEGRLPGFLQILSRMKEPF